MKIQLRPYQNSRCDERGKIIIPPAGKEWVVNFPQFDGPSPMIDGYGPTPQAALHNLRDKAKADKIGEIWFDCIDWENPK